MRISTCDAIHYRGVEKYNTDRYGFEEIRRFRYMHMMVPVHAPNPTIVTKPSQVRAKNPALFVCVRKEFPQASAECDRWGISVVFFFFFLLHLQSRLCALRLARSRRTRSHELQPLVSKKTCRYLSILQKTYLILRPLGLQLSALLLNNHLLLAVRQRPRHAEQQRTGADDPQRLAAHAEAVLEPRRDCVCF